LKKDFPKIIKGMKAEDRVLVLGTSLYPFSILFIIYLFYTLHWKFYEHSQQIN